MVTPGEISIQRSRGSSAEITHQPHYPARFLYRGYQYAEYIVGTGSLWKDSIARAAFTVDGSAIGGSNQFSANLNAANSRRLLSENALRIEVQNYKPDPNAVLHITIGSQRMGTLR
jgi:hypothetical protein